MVDPPKPANPRAMRLAELAGCWLYLSGCCPRSVTYPLALLARRLGGHWRLGEVLPRLRCSACGGRPTRLVLADRGDDSPYGSQARWKIDLAG